MPVFIAGWAAGAATNCRASEAAAKLAQGRQQVLCSVQIHGVEAVRELLEYRLQKRTGALGLSLSDPQCRQVDHGAGRLG